MNPSHQASASVPYLGPNGGPNGGSYYNDEESSMSTLPDPRSRALSPSSASIPGSPHTPHPDLSEEVASLSNKLINAINHQTNLDDTLNATRQQLSASQDRCAALEAAAQGSKDGREEMEELIRMGTLVFAADVAEERKKLIRDAAEEVQKRVKAEKERAEIESELENLTTALFEEANKMVIKAREEAQRDHIEMERENKKLEAKLKDTEALLKLHQDQLRDLKGVMEKMDEELVELNTRQSEEVSRKSADSSSARRSADIMSEDGGVKISSPVHQQIKGEVCHTLEEAPAVRRARKSVEDARLSLEHMQIDHMNLENELKDVNPDVKEELEKVVQQEVNEAVVDANARVEKAEERLEVVEKFAEVEHKAKEAIQEAQTLPRTSGMTMHM